MPSAVEPKAVSTVGLEPLLVGGSVDVESLATVAVIAPDASVSRNLLHLPREEPWGQTVARLQSPEGTIIGVSFTPVLHDQD